MRLLAAFFAVWCAATVSARIQFIGVMADSRRTIFAVRAEEKGPSKWVSLGDNVGAFVVSAYDSRTQTLTLRNGAESIVLALPESRVRLAADEVVEGLKRILNVPGARQMRDLLHPALRPLFKDSDLDGTVFRDMLAPGSTAEILPLTDEETKAFESGLADVEKVVGVRPKHGLWIKTAGHASMSFVVNTATGWYLAPSAPGKE